ncbi:acyl-CoA N-acyltransferase [Tilletiopsis washingtonensis]|uniref:Acyl-CoA N-acyltransferase n=1 Tax=Tilletiopsis washingtonensis TaxID=58919 RepID=A0A316ZBV9_9BASI|nr:acyl-CoA N-acyltransferase [Tilletiopsis washingtonensis]PWN98422.1 acyl-CoA N-acyltransferase [Tilletiopsis washingtonensis]
MATLSNPPQTYEPRRPAPVRSALPQRSALAALTPNNVGQLRRLNAVLFPVRFSERWYRDVLGRDVQLINRFVLFNDIPVGNICCRFERLDGGKKVAVYIMTLGVLAPYRRLGLASKLIAHLLSVAGVGDTVDLVDPNAPAPTPVKGKDGKETKPDPVTEQLVVESIYLHVQTGNDEAKAFYEKHGFKETKRVEDYYRANIEPRSAWLLERRD